MKNLLTVLALVLLISSTALAAGDPVNRLSGGASIKTLPVPTAQGGTGATTPAGSRINLGVTDPWNQANFPPSSITVSNIGATSSTIANRKSYPLASGSRYAYTIDTTHFYYSDGVPAGNQFGLVYSLTPFIPFTYGRLTLEFVATTKQLDMQVNTSSPGGYGSVSMEVDGQQVLDYQATGALFVQQNTAQAGAASTITLSSGASATTNFYANEYVYIYGGTGIGQRAQITAYNGSTKVATVTPAWATQPDATSTYVVSPSNTTYFQGSSNTYVPTLTFAGPERTHYIRIMTDNVLINTIGVDSSGTITAPAVPYKPAMFILADSFASGYSSISPPISWSSQICKNLNMWCKQSVSQGTGFIGNAGGNATTYAQRAAPPVNSWRISFGGASSGNATITQSGVTTGNLASNISASSLQTAMNAAFGANEWLVWVDNASNPGGSQYDYVLEDVGANAASTATLTVNAGTLAGGIVSPFSTQFTGDVAVLIPKSTSGATLPCWGIVANTTNDQGSLASLDSASQVLFSRLTTRFPQCTWVSMGPLMLIGPETGNLLTMQGTALTAATSYLPLLPNGNVPFITTFNASTGVGYLNGTTNNSTQSGTAGVNTDVAVGADGIHPTQPGAVLQGSFVTQQFTNLIKTMN